MTAQFRFARKAAADLNAIADYTMKELGPAQTKDYLRSLSRRFEWLARNP